MRADKAVFGSGLALAAFALGVIMPQEESVSMRRMAIVDAEGRERIVISSNSDPTLMMLDEAGSPALMIGLVGEAKPYANAAEASPFIQLVYGGGYISVGFESPQKGASGPGAAMQLIVPGDGGGMTSRMFVSSKEASLGFVELSPFPFPRLIARALSKAEAFFEARNTEGAVEFTTKK